MRTSTLSSLLALALCVYSQSSLWGQCGGIGWTGSATCTTGDYCAYENPYYSQCIPGIGSSSSSALPSTSLAITLSTKTSTSVATSKSSSSSVTSKASSSSATSHSSGPSSTLKSSSSASATVSSTCTGTFIPVSASAAFAALNPGWNLGNTLDATPDEGSWNNPPVTPSVLSAVVAQGFKSIRIPITWAYHFVGSSPTWTVNSTWLDRVETVIDEALALNIYVVINVHHDSWIWADPTASGANLTQIEEKFGRLWAQIGARFACKSSKLIFEPLNEPSGSTQDDATFLNGLNAIFLDEINIAGGFNSQRVVSLSGLGMDSVKTSEWFVRPTTYPSQPWGIQFHYYSPYDFIFSAWGKTIWGSDVDKASLLNDFSLFHGNFSGIPAFVGEWDSAPLNDEKAARWKYYDYFIRTANSFGYSSILWDNGLDEFNRTSSTWYDPVDIAVLMAAVAGTSNSLADSTTDPSTTTQNSSATFFHKVGDAVADASVPYLLNGNTLKSIKNFAGVTLSTAQYSMSSSGSLTLTAAYLSTLYTSTSAPGIKDTLTLTFSAGTFLTLQIVQWDQPVISTTTWALDTSADLLIPVTYKGLPEVAAVKAVWADGSYFDAWTVYLGALQQGRWTWGNWDCDSSHLILKQAGSTAIQATGESVTLTVEFFPRILGQNSVNITITQ